MKQTSGCTIVAHRGYRARYPENTLSAFHAAFRLGVPMIELDVTLSRDGYPVVIHDETLNRTSNGIGPVKDHTLAQLKTLDAGSWFSPFFCKEPIPTLSEVLNALGNKIAFNIEIKPEAVDSHDQHNGIETKVLDLIHQYSDINTCLISSFHPFVIQRLSGLDIKGLRLSFLTEKRGLDDDILNFMVTHKAYSWNPDYPVLSSDQVMRCHNNHIRVYTYTVNGRSEGRRCLNMGVDGLITDEPRLFGY